MKNPHFDDHRVIWKDEYSGLYEPVDYSEQFDHEWRLFLEDKTGFNQHVGVATDDIWIDDRIYDITGAQGVLCPDKPDADRSMGCRQMLDLRFSADHFQGKRCLDAACGAGRWTRALMALGAQVKSIDVSEHGLKSVARYNSDVERLDIFDIPGKQHLQNAFDFTLGWGIVMHTHDPKLAFSNLASTVREGGELYVMVYAPTLHNRSDILEQRRHYHTKLKTFEEKLAYAYEVADQPENALNYLDMLNTFYNWVVEEETIHNWFRENGFSEVITLNTSEKYPVAYHVLGRKRKFMPAMYDDEGNRVPDKSDYDIDKAVTLTGQFVDEPGHSWSYTLNEHIDQSDSGEFPHRSKLILLEDGEPLWHRHIAHDEIRSKGKGLYSHWDYYLLFSTSDNSDPNTNGRTYQIVFTED